MKKNLLLLFATVLVFFLIGEVALYLFTPFPIHSGKNRVFDERLLYVLNTSLKDVDDNGFRNPGIPERVDVVTIGDSMTYGNGVTRDESWPYQLADMTGKSVYNFGVGSYGVYQYYELFGRALKFQPKHVIIALHVANDLAHNRDLLNLPYWRRLADEFGLQTVHSLGPPPNRAGGETRTLRKKYKPRSSLRAMIPASATYSAFKYYKLKYRRRSTPANSYTISKGPISLSIERRAPGTVGRFTDLNRPDVAENFFNSKILFEKIIETAKDTGVTLGVLLVPSRVAVYYEWGLRKGALMTEEFVTIAKYQDILSKNYQKFFAERGVEVVDATEHLLAALDRSLAAGKFLYHSAHPPAAGYEAVARAATEFFD